MKRFSATTATVRARNPAEPNSTGPTSPSFEGRIKRPTAGAMEKDQSFYDRLNRRLGIVARGIYSFSLLWALVILLVYYLQRRAARHPRASP